MAYTLTRDRSSWIMGDVCLTLCPQQNIYTTDFRASQPSSSGEARQNSSSYSSWDMFGSIGLRRSSQLSKTSSHVHRGRIRGAWEPFEALLPGRVLRAHGCVRAKNVPRWATSRHQFYTANIFCDLRMADTSNFHQTLTRSLSPRDYVLPSKSVTRPSLNISSHARVESLTIFFCREPKLPEPQTAKGNNAAW
jgi:hypothetical protein